MIPFALLLAFQDSLPTEEDYYRAVTVPAPPEVALEIGGMALWEDGTPIVCTRRGYVYFVQGAYGPAEDVRFVEFAQGLQEPLGLLVKDGWIYVMQRAELSRMRDTDGDLRVDVIETVSDDLPISGSYHEYAFGPRIGPDGELWVTSNRAFDDEPFGHVDWRGWALRFSFDGKMTPVACGLRSPAGVEAAPWGGVFYTDNQGEWCGASKLAHIEEGEFHGHPFGIGSTARPEWTHGVLDEVPDGVLMPDVPETIPNFKLPAVWFPYDKMGRSPSGMVWDTTDGAFGPFAGQVFVGDQYDAAVFRVFLEEVNGHWQGACFRFRENLASGVIRVAWGADDSLLVGMSDRGWGSRGAETAGLQRLEWTGAVPFEVHEMRAKNDGFELTFTEPLDASSAADPESYSMSSYTYLLHEDYGSPEVETEELAIESVEVLEGGTAVRLRVAGLRAGYVHELHLDGVRAASGRPLLHPAAYYTLIEIPE